MRVPFVHGTSGKWPVLRPGFGGSTILKNDPNPVAVYAAMKSRAKVRGVEQFAQEAVRRRGGEAVVAHGKFDTAKGWAPTNLTAWGKKHLGSVEAAQGLVSELDRTPDKASRGPLWKKLQLGVGSWANADPSATLAPKKYRVVPATTSPSVSVAA